MRDKSISINTSVYGWWILGLTSVLMFGNYYVYDSIGPVAAQLESELGFTDSQIGSLNAIYSLPNIFLVLIGGVIVDRYGASASRVALWTTALCLIGAVLTAWRGDIATMLAGRFLFGTGAETMIVAVTVSLGIWFARGGVAFAFALSLSIARAGSYVADLSPVWAGSFYDKGWQAPLMLAVGFAALSMLAVIAYRWVDQNKTPPPPLIPLKPESEKMRWRDVVRFGTSFWYILALCVLFYSAIVPYRSTFAIKYFQHAHHLSLESAAVINSYVYLAAIFATPLFGWIADRYGHRALSMVFGSMLLPLAFVLAMTGGQAIWATTVLLGISYSLIPAVLWPSVIKLVEANRLGTAYGLLFMLQNVGLTLCNVVAGWLNDLNGAGVDNPAGYGPMIIFFVALSMGGLIFSIALWRRELGPHSHGLELPGSARP
jgi:MFS family permease